MPLDAPQPLWMPPKPAIIRAWRREDARPIERPKSATLMVNQLCGFGVGGPQGPAVAMFAGGTGIGTDLSTYTFTDHAIGTASADRVVVVHIFGTLVTTAKSVSSVTIGGNAATLYGTQVDTTPSRPKGAVAALLATTGTTATIVVNWTPAGNLESCYILVWALTGTSGQFNVHDFRSDGGAGNPKSTSALIVPSRGAVMTSAVVIDTSSTAGGLTWTGPTEDTDFQGETSNSRVGAATLSDQPASAGYTVSVSSGLDNDLGALLMATSFAPA